MTYKQAIKNFQAQNQQWLGQAKTKSDKPAMGQAWVEYIDTLHREKQISTEQARRWGNPYNQ